jgi:ribosomal-protein-alanine N-acetyltransferase
MHTVTLTTQRLALRPLALCDLAAFHTLLTMPGVRRYLLDGDVVDQARAREMLEMSCTQFAQTGAGLWAVRLPDDESLLGFAGLWPFHEPPVVELVYALADDQRGLGFAGEAATAVLDYAHRTLGWTSIRASTDSPNIDSLRVLVRLGFTECGRMPGGFGETVVLSRSLP